MSGTEGRWWRPALQLPGLVILIAAMLLGRAMQNPRPPLAQDTGILVNKPLEWNQSGGNVTVRLQGQWPDSPAVCLKMTPAPEDVG